MSGSPCKVDPEMISRDLEAAMAGVAGSTVATFGASLFEMSPVWKSIERQTQMFERILTQSVAMSTFASKSQQIAELVAHSAIEQVSSYQRLAEDLAQAALVNLKLPEMRFPDLEASFKAYQIVEHTLNSLATIKHPSLAMPANWEGVLRQLPELAIVSEEKDELEDHYLAVTASPNTWALSPKDRVLLLRAFWVFFVVLQLLTPEGRQFLKEHPAIWAVVNSIVFVYHPGQ